MCLEDVWKEKVIVTLGQFGFGHLLLLQYFCDTEFLCSQIFIFPIILGPRFFLYPCNFGPQIFQTKMC